MKTGKIEISTNDGKRYLRQEGKYILIRHGNECNYATDVKKINIPLFYKIALYTSERRSYKNVLMKFFDELQKENIKYMFNSKESLENATQACGKPGGRVAFLLGLFCRYYNKLPRSVNIVKANCEDCGNNNLRCGTLEKCGDYYGCGEGVRIPLEKTFRIETIPEIRAAIRTEEFPIPETIL